MNPNPTSPARPDASSVPSEALELHAAGMRALEAGDTLRALDAFDAALTLAPEWREPIGARFNAVWRNLKTAVDSCDWRRYDYLQRMLRAGIRQGMYMLGETALASPALDAGDLLHGARLFCEERFPIAESALAALAPRSREGRLRVGLVGADFYNQATAYLLTGVIERMDRERFELFAYDFGPLPAGSDDPMHARCVAAYDHFTAIDRLNDRQAAELIRGDDIDVLLHLRGAATGRLGIFALRPCAVQIQYLYFPGSSGASFMDYIVGDDTVTPPGLEYGFAERVLRLPGCYQPNDERRNQPARRGRADFGIPQDAVVMANFNQPYKLTPDMFDAWCTLLRADPQRILWLLANDETVRRNLRREAAVRGVNPRRIIFAAPAPNDVHLARLACADLVLDTFPYGGHTLTSDALWVGTPVVTRFGPTFASRVPYSLLQAVGLESLACPDLAAYEAKAEDLLSRPPELQRLRQHLVQGRASFALFDSALYASRFGDLLWKVAGRAY